MASGRLRLQLFGFVRDPLGVVLDLLRVPLDRGDQLLALDRSDLEIDDGSPT
jgi:hypothetical protein